MSARTSAAVIGFNEAPIHESGKFGTPGPDYSIDDPLQ